MLDEIGEMPTMLQAKLQRVLEERVVHRLGSRKDIPVDVRLLAATNKEPHAAVRDGTLREDLLYRLNVISIHLPKLSERLEDLPLLTQHLITRLASKHNRPARFISPAALDALRFHTWPGNVRELRNVIERAVYRHEDAERPVDEIVFDPFHSPWAPSAIEAPAHPVATMVPIAPDSEEPAQLAAVAAPPSATSDFRAAVADYERQLLEEALRRNRFNQRATASALNLSYDQLRHALKRHKLQDSAA